MRTLPARNGFTLLELLVALAVFGLVMVGALSLYASNQQAYRAGRVNAEIQQNARVALQAATREIRIAGYDPSGVLATLGSPTPIQVAEDDRITFVADVDRDGVLDQVSYRTLDGRFLREMSSWDGTGFPAPTSSAVADGVASWTLDYFDDTTPTNVAVPAPVAAGALGTIRRIRLGVVTTSSAAESAGTFSLLADVRLRN